MDSLARLFQRIRRSVLRRRRLLAALSAAAAVATGVQAASSPPPPTTRVVTVAREVPAGAVLRNDDLGTSRLPPESVPAGMVSAREAIGRTTAGPLRAGEPVTDVRLVSGSMLAGHPEAVAAPIRIGDPGAVALLRIGDHIDVLAADPQGSAEASLLADDVPVIALPQDDDAGDSGLSGGLVVVAVSGETARALAAAGVSSYLSLTIAPPDP